MKIAIIGAGNVGGTLGAAWAQNAGHEILFGVRNPKRRENAGAAAARSAARRAPLRRLKPQRPPISSC